MGNIRAAIIGTGFMGATHAEALRRIEGVDIVAVASHRLSRAEELAKRFGISTHTDDWREVVRREDVNVVHNCTPNDLHFEINRAALEAGKHVVSEKPLTIGASEASELVGLAKEKGVVNAVNFNYRFYPLVQHARVLVENGELGPVHLVHGHYAQDWLLHETDYNWRVDSESGGASRAFADIGSHWCDLIQFVTGRRIIRVCADLFIVHPTRKKPREVAETFQESASTASDDVDVRTEDGANILFQLEGGARGAVTISQVSAGRKNHEWFEIDGARSALAWSQERPNELWIGRRDRPNEVLIKDPSLLDAEVRQYAHYPGGHPEGYPDGPKNLFANVYRAVRRHAEGKVGEPDYPTFADGLRAARLVDAVLESSRREAWVEVATDKS
ncbi:Gfo/Idh/MocA family oxidoreductase [soil metagenome]